MLLTAAFACEGIASIAEKTALSQKGGYLIFSPILQWLLQYMYLNARMDTKESMWLFIFNLFLKLFNQYYRVFKSTYKVL